MAEYITASDGDAATPLAASTADMDLKLNICKFLDYIPDIIELDPRGDRVLMVGTNTCQIKDGVHHHEAAMRFRVCSRSVGRFSPVMSAMLFGNFVKANQEMIAFPEDNPKAMKTLLNIAHGHLDPVYDIRKPENGNFLDDVYQIAVLANKYKVTPMLRPWAPTWISILERGEVASWRVMAERDRCTLFCPTDTDRLGWEKALYVANEFGHVEIYKDVFECLYLSTREDDELFSCTLDPSSVKDQIIIFRWQFIENITTVFRDAIDTLTHCGLDDATAGRYACSAARPGTRGDCKIHTLGVIIRHLSRHLLWPLPPIEEFAGNTFSLYHRITDAMWSERGLHKDCSIRATLDEALEEARKIPRQDILSQPEIEEMLARAASLGCSNKTSES